MQATPVTEKVGSGAETIGAMEQEVYRSEDDRSLPVPEVLGQESLCSQDTGEALFQLSCPVTVDTRKIVRKKEMS